MKFHSSQMLAAVIFTAAISLMIAAYALCAGCVEKQSSAWPSATPEGQDFDPAKLDQMWAELHARNTSAFLIIRNGRIVFERYAKGFTRTTPHFTASLAKSLVGGLSLMLLMDDGRIHPDDRASKFVPQWTGFSNKNAITIRQLATHTSGIEDAEAGHLPHDRLRGWKGDFWKRLSAPHDPFTISRDLAPVLDLPGTKARYSNPGFAMLGYCLTASLRGAPQQDLRSLLKHRIMDPLGVPPGEWSVGYGTTVTVEGLPLVATWGGGNFSPNACARIGQLLLGQGAWEGRRLISRSTVEEATHNAGMPNHASLGWWVNRNPDGTRFWAALPDDAFWGLGAQAQFLLVVPSLSLVVLRSGGPMSQADNVWTDVGQFVVNPLMHAFAGDIVPPYPKSAVIQGIEWGESNRIVRFGLGSDNWPTTWGDDGALYTAYGDGWGFRPYVPKKLSLGFARINGFPTNLVGKNIRSPSGEQTGNGRAGLKASGIVMIDGTLFLWARNAGNARLAWSDNHARAWTWSNWRFTESFGCPAFLNFGRNYSGARDGYVYVYSPDNDTAYSPADRLVLARAPKDKIRERAAYEFFVRREPDGNVIWSTNIAKRGAVFLSRGAVGRSHVTYDPGLNRYLLTMICTGSDGHYPARVGVFDAPEPWGPWTTVFYTDAWDVGPGESADFPSKWLSRDGRRAWLEFSGNDSLSMRSAMFHILPRPATNEPAR